MSRRVRKFYVSTGLLGCSFVAIRDEFHNPHSQEASRSPHIPPPLSQPKTRARNCYLIPTHFPVG